MKHIEDEYRDRFRDKELSDDNFDATGLWDAIAEDLEEPKNENNRKFLYWWLSGIMAIFLTIVGIYYVNQKQNKIQPLSNTKITKTENRDSNNSDKIVNNKIENFSYKNSNNTTKSQEKNKKKIETTSIAESGSKRSTKTSDNRTETSSIDRKNDQNQRSANRKKNEVSPFYLPAKTIDSKDEKALVDSSSFVVSSNREQTVNTTDIDDLVQNKDEKDHYLNATLLPLKRTSLKASLPKKAIKKWGNSTHNGDRNQTTQFRIGVFSGANIFRLNTSSDTLVDLAKERQQSEKLRSGTSLGVEASVIYKKRWSLNTGIEYHDLHTKLDYQSIKNTMVTRENQLLAVWIDETTGDSLNASYGDTTTTRTTTRTVIHHNKYQRVSIPLTIGVQYQTRRWNYGIALGGAFYIFTKQSGKSLNQLGEIISFGNGDTSKPLKKTGISFRINPFIGYRLTKNMTMQISPQWSWSKHGKLSNTDFKIFSHQYNVNIGINYIFSR